MDSNPTFRSGRAPDFIIGGAMKCGTSSMHTILSSHEKIYIPDEEIHFFCMDDIVQHPAFIKYDPDRIDFEADVEKKRAWYSSFFESAEENQVLGEDSTVYLASTVAPQRIRRHLPDVKLIFLIRNPVDRTYSHYWHRVLSGRATYQFERELQQGPTLLHLRSYYKPQLERYFDLFPQDQIKVVLFERFTEHTQTVVDEVCSYLGLSRSVDLDTVRTHARASHAPRWLWLFLVLNCVLDPTRDHYDAHLPGMSNDREETSHPLRRILHLLQRGIPRDESYPPMRAGTRERLARIYAHENDGLGDLIDVDLGKYWPFMTR